LVVKNGSNACSHLGAHAGPVAHHEGTRGPRPPRPSTFHVSILSTPAAGMESRALTARFISTCLSWPLSARTCHRSSAGAHLHRHPVAGGAVQHARDVVQDRVQAEFAGRTTSRLPNVRAGA
jgi:hypothetical protein